MGCNCISNCQRCSGIVEDLEAEVERLRAAIEVWIGKDSHLNNSYSAKGRVIAMRALLNGE